MQEDVGEHAEGAIARRVVVLVAEDGGENLRFGGILEQFDLLFGFGGQVGLERVDVRLHAGRDPLDQPYRFAILAVRVFLFRHAVRSNYTCKNDTGSLNRLGGALRLWWMRE